MANDINMLAKSGIDLCRQGAWTQGLTFLARVVEEKTPEDRLPSTFYSYLGYAIAKCEHRVKEGLELCERTVNRGLYDPENFLNLARTHLLKRNRRAAMKSIKSGLKIDPHHSGLHEFKREMGIRRQPVFSFLPRSFFLNRWLGKLRHQLTSGSSD